MSDHRYEETSRWDAEQVRRGAPQRRSRQKPPRGARVRYWAFVLVISAILAGCAWLLINDLCSLNKKSVNTTIHISSSDKLSTISGKLHDAGLVKYKWFFTLFGKVDKAGSKIGAGTYKVDSNMDYLALINAMHGPSNGNSATVKVTIPEGYTVRQIIALLAKSGVSNATELTKAAKTAKFRYDFVDSHSKELSRLEGFLFPDTYEFFSDEDATSAFERLLDNFQAKMKGSRTTEISASKYNLKQIITIASLIEKESAGSDRKKISSVIYNRLADKGNHGTYGMLQIDASLLYAVPNHTGAITDTDKKVDSPYNLYKNSGLPPTPIANPGMASIDAALHPDTTRFYYYALGKDGTHHFFTTYGQHSAFVKSDQYAG